MAISPLTAIFTIAPSAFGAPGDFGDFTRIPSSIEELRAEVARWSRKNPPCFSAAEADAVADWLNRNFYRIEG